MIATTNPTVIPFETLLAKMEPSFRYFAKNTMKLRSDNFDDAVQDMTSTAFDIYLSLVRRGKQIFYTAIASFAIKRYNSGRRFAGSSTTDVLSDETRIIGRCETCNLSQFDIVEGSLLFLIDYRSNAADIIQFKIDYADWKAQQSKRDQKIIHLLAVGETTGDVAKKCRVSPSLISHYRRRYYASWNDFIADKNEPAAVKNLAA